MLSFHASTFLLTSVCMPETKGKIAFTRRQKCKQNDKFNFNSDGF